MFIPGVRIETAASGNLFTGEIPYISPWGYREGKGVDDER